MSGTINNGDNITANPYCWLDLMDDNDAKFKSPKYQRPYIWTKDQVKGLLDDIAFCGESGEEHFTGSLILNQMQRSNDGRKHDWLIIDGQQRITTLSLVTARFIHWSIENFSSIIRDTESHDGADVLDRIEELFNCIVIQKTKLHENRLELSSNETDDKAFKSMMNDTYDFYDKELGVLREAVISGAEIPDSIKHDCSKACSKESISNSKYLKDAVACTDNFLNRKSNVDNGEYSKYSFAQWFDCIFTGMYKILVVLIQPGKSDPNEIFESLNANGTPLNNYDLFRNWVYLQISKKYSSSDEKSNQFSDLERMIKDNEKLEFFNTWMMSIDGITSKKNSYNRFKRMWDVKWADHWDTFISDVTTAINGWNRIFKRKEENSSLKEAYAYWGRCRADESFNPTMLALYRVLFGNEWDDKKKKLARTTMIESCKIIESYLIRRTVCNRGTTHIGDSDVPRKLRVLESDINSDSLFGDIVNTLKNSIREYSHSENASFPHDDEFMNGFQTADMYKSKKNPFSLYVLWKIDTSGYNEGETVSIDNASVEHIMPQTPNEDWKKELVYTDADFDQDKYDSYKKLIGNLTIVSGRTNSKLSNLPYEKKRDMTNSKDGKTSCAGYSSSAFSITREISQYEHDGKWTFDSITDRSRKFAEKALTIWPDVTSD